MSSLKKSVYSTLVILLSVTISFSSDARGNKEKKQTPREETTSDSTKTYIESVIKSVIADYDENGAEAVFASVNAGEYTKDNIYPFISQAKLDGVFMAHGLVGAGGTENDDKHSVVGTYNYNVVDGSGLYIMARMIEQAREDEGFWISYTWNNPGTNTVENKSAWVVLHDGLLFVAGYYP